MADPYRAFHFKIDTGGASAVPEDAFFVRTDASTTTSDSGTVDTSSHITIAVQPVVDEINSDLGAPDAFDFF